MIGSKVEKIEPIAIPAKIIKKLKEGTIVEARVEKGKLLIIGAGDKITKIMQYAGIWEDEKVDKVFSKIRRDWGKWQKSLSV